MKFSQVGNPQPESKLHQLKERHILKRSVVTPLLKQSFYASSGDTRLFQKTLNQLNTSAMLISQVAATITKNNAKENSNEYYEDENQNYTSLGQKSEHITSKVYQTQMVQNHKQFANASHKTAQSEQDILTYSSDNYEVAEGISASLALQGNKMTQVKHAMKKAQSNQDLNLTQQITVAAKQQQVLHHTQSTQSQPFDDRSMRSTQTYIPNSTSNTTNTSQFIDNGSKTRGIGSYYQIPLSFSSTNNSNIMTNSHSRTLQSVKNIEQAPLHYHQPKQEEKKTQYIGTHSSAQIQQILNGKIESLLAQQSSNQIQSKNLDNGFVKQVAKPQFNSQQQGQYKLNSHVSMQYLQPKEKQDTPKIVPTSNQSSNQIEKTSLKEEKQQSHQSHQSPNDDTTSQQQLQQLQKELAQCKDAQVLLNNEISQLTSDNGSLKRELKIQAQLLAFYHDKNDLFDDSCTSPNNNYLNLSQSPLNSKNVLDSNNNNNNTSLNQQYNNGQNGNTFQKKTKLQEQVHSLQNYVEDLLQEKETLYAAFLQIQSLNEQLQKDMAKLQEQNQKRIEQEQMNLKQQNKDQKAQENIQKALQSKSANKEIQIQNNNENFGLNEFQTGSEEMPAVYDQQAKVVNDQQKNKRKNNFLSLLFN